MALRDDIRRDIGPIDPSERALLRDALPAPNDRVFPSSKTQSAPPGACNPLCPKPPHTQGGLSSTRITVSALIRPVLAVAVLLINASPTKAQGGHHLHPGNGVAPVPDAGFKPSPSPPPPVETPTTLTFFQTADFSGAPYIVQLGPAQSAQATRIIPTSELAGAGFAGKISAIRIACGSRPSRASLFDVDWGAFSKGTMIECAAGQTIDMNLGPHDLDKKIHAAALVVHVRSTDNQPHAEAFSTLFAAVWKTQVQSLGPGAVATQTRIWLDDFQDLHIQQFLTLDSNYCTARNAVFEIRVNLSASKFKPVVKGYGVSQYVDFGFGDMWGCHDGMMKDLSNGIASAIASLQAQLPTLVLSLAPESPIYYFAPEGSTSDFDLFFYR